MSWYNVGTVTLTTGSAIVDGAGTAFVGNAIAGQALLTPDGRLMEIAEVISATRLRLVRAYAGGTVGGVVYDIIPTSADLTTVIERLNTLITRYRAVVDGVGQGLFSDGAATSPAMRFTADQDTGIFRSGTNELAIATGGMTRVIVTGDGHVQLNGVQKSIGYGVAERFVIDGQSICHYGMTTGCILAGAVDPQTVLAGYGGLVFATAGAQRMRLDNQGNLLVGTTAATANGARVTVKHGVDSQYTAALLEGLNASGEPQILVFNGGPGANTWNTSGAVLFVSKNTNTGRAGNFAGTINASGADYAEYMTKAAGCGTIAKGDVCGVDRDGCLTRTWADAISFVIKSTDPSYVGGDIWGRSVGPRPEGPGEAPAAPIAPPAAPAGEEEADVAAWRVILAAYPGQLAAYQEAHEAWATAKNAYDTALPVWEAALEVERQKVDRIAFSGQVPVNVAGDFAVGDYIIAAASGTGIKAIAVPADTITFDQYRRRVGKVWAVRDGRAWVDVQHG